VNIYRHCVCYTIADVSYKYCKKGYQPRTNIRNDEKGDLVAESHSILAEWRKHFSQLLNVQGVNAVGQTATRTAVTSF
jgi:hypothetical protein